MRILLTTVLLMVGVCARADDLNSPTLGVSAVAAVDCPDFPADAPTKNCVVFDYIDPLGPLGKIAGKGVLIVTSFNGTAVKDSEDYREAVDQSKAGVDAELEALVKDGDGWQAVKITVQPIWVRDYAVASMIRERDEANSLTMYRHNSSPKLSRVSESLVPYVMKYDKGAPNMSVRVSHMPPLKARGDLSEFGFGFDGQFVWPIRDRNYPVRRDVFDGHSRQWMDAGVDAGLRAALLQASSKDDSVLSFSGITSPDRPITAVERYAIKAVLQVYEVIKEQQSKE